MKIFKAIIVLFLMLSGANAQITIASTTSTSDSGLFEHLLPLFTKKTGIHVRVVSLGTGQALDAGRRGNADVVFVHAKAQEEKFVTEGFGVKRFPVMYNDFIILGDAQDTANIKSVKTANEALALIKQKEAPFISRGDKSGTHIAEISLWAKAGITMNKERDLWYKEIGQSMGAALNMAVAMNAYVLSDRGTWLAFKNKGSLAVLLEGDKALFNQYGIMLVNPEKHPHVKQKEAQAFIDWVLSLEGQTAINSFKVNGKQLFFGNANTNN